MDAESARLKQCREGVAWKRWGPYLSERQWGTVREDYSADGDAWRYFSHDQARSRAYRWGEDGIAGVSDDKQRLCLALALWNGRDPILKERLFGLTNSEGNHGEDVKEYYFYADCTPTHSYMRYVYKYPQDVYPYDELVRVNGQRSRDDMEYELLDTGVFDDDRYFDVVVEYAKEGPEDLCVRIVAYNRGPEAARIHLMPTLWFRNTWLDARDTRPMIDIAQVPQGRTALRALHAELGERFLLCEGQPEILFTENETNNERLFGGHNPSPYVKDAFHEYVVRGRRHAVNPAAVGSKACARYALDVAPHGAVTVRLRLCDAAARNHGIATVDSVMKRRRDEADAFYATIAPGATPDEANILRQSLAGLLWSKQYYGFDLDRWLREHDANMLEGGTRLSRNREWLHMYNDDVISMPDKWEYPWYAAWDLAFHTVALSLVDRDFAQEQLDLMLRPLYMHPNGQIPAYEWNFSDVNPPVHAWAILFMNTVGKVHGEPLDRTFLRSAFDRLSNNFTWWVNRKDRNGRNVFEGGFLGLDNIGVFDRSAALPGGGTLEQADGTAWMAFYSQTMMALALELAVDDPYYEDAAGKYLEHFLWIGGSMDRPGGHADELWDEEDGFFYDVLRLPDGHVERIRLRSMVGLLPLCATLVLDAGIADRFPRFLARAKAFIARHPELTAGLAELKHGARGRVLLAVVGEAKLRRILARMLDESRFLGAHGLRAMSKQHEAHPYELDVAGERFSVKYLPAESDSGLFGGNSNWRGPVWMPVNLLIVRALLEFYRYFGDDFQVECPTGSGKLMNLYQVAMEISDRLISTFERDANGRRPVYGGSEKFQRDPHWRDLLLFYEYFHGDNGAGLGASHQTGWTALVARLIWLKRTLSAERLLDAERVARARGAVIPSARTVPAPP
jgi:hypothetical protein